ARRLVAVLTGRAHHDVAAAREAAAVRETRLADGARRARAPERADAVAADAIARARDRATRIDAHAGDALLSVRTDDAHARVDAPMAEPPRARVGSGIERRIEAGIVARSAVAAGLADAALIGGAGHADAGRLDADALHLVARIARRARALEAGADALSE